jgi:hypothetical protein
MLAAQAQHTCATAIALIPASYNCIFAAGSEVPSPICSSSGAGATMGRWYSFTSPVDTGVTVSTAASGVDTRIQVYTGTCGALTCYANDDDGGPGLTAVCAFNALAGVTYYITFDDRWSSNSFTFSVTLGPSIDVPEGVVSFTPTPLNGAQGSTMGVVDMNGDFLDDVVSVSSSNVNVLQQGPGGTLVAHNYPTSPADHDASWSMSAGDLDNNGYNDLQYGGGDGVTYMMANSTGTGFSEVSFPQYVFSQRGNMVDINNDGWLDAFMCHDVDANVYYLNDGSGGLTFHQGGLGPDCGNYGSIWTDYDGDGDLDLFVAKCGCDPVDIMMRNNGDGTFTDIAALEGFADGQQSWSSAWGDFDNDGDMDVLVGSSGSAFQKLMRNNGDGTFTNVTAGSGFDAFGGTSIEWNTRDFNNDGHLDIIGGGAIMYGNGDLTFFAPNDDAPGNGAIGDLNNDGFLDIVNYMNTYINSGNDYHWLTVNLIGTTSNRNGIGAKVHVTSPMGTQLREIRSGDGFAYMSSLNAHFGLGLDTTVEMVEVDWPSGVVDQAFGPAIDGAITITEGSLGTSGITGADLKAPHAIYPNPVRDVLTVAGTEGGHDGTAVVIDVTGKRVMEGVLRGGRLDISRLRPGVYTLSIETARGPARHRFMKL